MPLQMYKSRLLGISVDFISCAPQPTAQSVPAGLPRRLSELSLRFRLLPCTPELAAATAGIVAYSPLGRGMLTGAIKTAADLHESDGRVVRMPRFQGENFDKVCPWRIAVLRMCLGALARQHFDKVPSDSATLRDLNCLAGADTSRC